MELMDADKDPDKKWWTIDIRDVGEKPLKVPEGTHIHVKCKVTSDETRRCHYGYNGYKENYNKIENQDYDFDMDYSCFNDNSSSDNWGQFPYILYS